MMGCREFRKSHGRKTVLAGIENSKQKMMWKKLEKANILHL